MLAATQSPSVGFVIAECGGSVSPIEQQLYVGSNLCRAKRGLPEAQVQEIERFRRLKYRGAAGLESRATFDAELARMQSLAGFAETGGELPAGFWAINGAYDPVAALERLHQPALFLLAEPDSSTPSEATQRVLETTLARTGHADHRVVVIPNASHEMFEASQMTCDVDIPHAVRLAPGYTTVLRTWLQRHVRSE